MQVMAEMAGLAEPQVTQVVLVKMDYIFMEALVAVSVTAGLRVGPVPLLQAFALVGVLVALRAAVAVAVRVTLAVEILGITLVILVMGVPEVVALGVEGARAATEGLYLLI
jgi:hypothetical protein